MSLRTKVFGLNKWLTGLYNAESRLSIVLLNLGFSEREIESLHKEHVEHMVTSAIELIKERLVPRNGNDRLFQIISRRYGWGGTPPETLQKIGFDFGISRERVRQLQVKALKRCRSRVNRQRWEEGLKMVANALLEGDDNPPNFPLSHSQKSADVSQDQKSVEESGTDSAKPLSEHDSSQLAERIFSILEACPISLSVSMLAHVLFGSKGPVVDSLMERYRFAEYGVWKSRGYKNVRQSVKDFCETRPKIELVDGKVKLKGKQC